jgi:hypothetical protein
MVVETLKVYIKIKDNADPVTNRGTVGIKSPDGQYGYWDYTDYDNVEDVIKYDLPRIYQKYKEVVK